MVYVLGALPPFVRYINNVFNVPTQRGESNHEPDTQKVVSLTGLGGNHCTVDIGDLLVVKSGEVVEIELYVEFGQVDRFQFDNATDGLLRERRRRERKREIGRDLYRYFKIWVIPLAHFRLTYKPTVSNRIVVG